MIPTKPSGYSVPDALSEQDSMEREILLLAMPREPQATPLQREAKRDASPSVPDMGPM